MYIIYIKHKEHNIIRKNDSFFEIIFQVIYYIKTYSLRTAETHWVYNQFQYKHVFYIFL